jgi:hypothetical protein
MATFNADGDSFDPVLDGARLSNQLKRVRSIMVDHKWRSLRAIAAATGGSEAGCSARLRDLRKEQFGGYVVERRRVSGLPGVWQYRVLPPIRGGQQELFESEATAS